MRERGREGPREGERGGKERGGYIYIYRERERERYFTLFLGYLTQPATGKAYFTGGAVSIIFTHRQPELSHPVTVL